MKKYFNYFLVILFLSICSISMKAQVGINTENPFSGSELDIQNAILNGNIVPKGILIPRVTQKQRDLIDVSAVTQANGLFIYNLDEGCYNYYSKTESEWRSLCGNQGQAEFSPIKCSDITVNGSFIEGNPITLSNTLSLKMNVLKPGSYSISATTENGYYFNITGVALLKGELNLSLPAFGTPVSAGLDNLTFTGVTISDISCIPKVDVQKQVGEYSINCSNVSVYGDYYKGVALTTTNYIEVAVTVSSLGSYSISTESKNGISFSAKGVFSSLGTNVVRLVATGTPTINSDFSLGIYSHTMSGNTECSATIPIILPAMTYAIVGTGAYSWSSVRSTVLANKSTFNKTGIIKMGGFTKLWETIDGGQAANLLKNGSGGKFPDVVLYFSYGSTGAATFAPVLSDYIKKGGCVIYGTTDYGTIGALGQANSILGGIFGADYAKAVGINQYATDGGQDIYPLANNLSDPILNGPFGNAAGQYWGEDNLGSIVVPQLPPNSVQLASAYNSGQKSSVNPAVSILWYNNSYNFVYFGDCVAASTTDVSTFWYAAYYPSYYPGTKLFGSQGLRRYVYNSVLELNAVAWCIKKAAINGINSY